MSYTARPPFTGGMSNQNQQQQGGQSNMNIGTSGIPNMPMVNNASTNHLANTSGSSTMSVIDQKILQQQLLLQSQLLMQGQQFQQPQTSQNQQAKFVQQPNNSQSLTHRIMSEMLNANDKNGSLAQQTQQLQQFVQLQAINNIMQIQQATQQKSFQQQTVPLPTNTTITPVSRQNLQSLQKHVANYTRTNAPNKNQTQTNSNPMQSRKTFPNAQKTTQIVREISPTAMISPTVKVYADILANKSSNAQCSLNSTPSITITKTNSPSSGSGKMAGMANKSTNATSPNVSFQKSFLSEAISMSLGNIPSTVKTSQPPSVTVIPTTKSLPITTQKASSQNLAALRKLTPTSPRTKQTPRKNTNPVRTTTSSPQSAGQIVTLDAKVTNSNISMIQTLAKAPISLPNANQQKSVTNKNQSTTTTSTPQPSNKPIKNDPPKTVTIECTKKVMSIDSTDKCDKQPIESAVNAKNATNAQKIDDHIISSDDKIPSKTASNQSNGENKKNAKTTAKETPIQLEKVKRNRLKAIPYQSPTPEIELVSKISATMAKNAHKKKIDEDKLTLFYKNEFLAVRNADGGFFLCQTMNNVYKSSPRIRIRWLSEEPANKNIYCLDFYDTTDIECVLTSVSLDKLSKDKFQLEQSECDRIESILKKALDVENGIVERPNVTEENPDGLDLSLYTDESQIEKKISGKRKLNQKSEKISSAKRQKVQETKWTKKSPEKVEKSPSPVKQKLKTSPKEQSKDQMINTKGRPATKRKLDSNETQGDAKDAESDATKMELNQSDKESIKQTIEKKVIDSTSASRTTRRQRN